MIRPIASGTSLYAGTLVLALGCASVVATGDALFDLLEGASRRADADDCDLAAPPGSPGVAIVRSKVERPLPCHSDRDAKSS